MTTQRFTATGLTCGHCVHAVTDELTALDGVTEVEVELVAGGASVVTLTGDREVGGDEVSAALADAGDYHLVTG